MGAAQLSFPENEHHEQRGILDRGNRSPILVRSDTIYSFVSSPIRSTSAPHDSREKTIRVVPYKFSRAVDDMTHGLLSSNDHGSNCQALNSEEVSGGLPSSSFQLLTVHTCQTFQHLSNRHTHKRSNGDSRAVAVGSRIEKSSPRTSPRPRGVTFGETRTSPRSAGLYRPIPKSKTSFFGSFGSVSKRIPTSTSVNLDALEAHAPVTTYIGGNFGPMLTLCIHCVLEFLFLEEFAVLEVDLAGPVVWNVRRKAPCATARQFRDEYELRTIRVGIEPAPCAFQVVECKVVRHG